MAKNIVIINPGFPEWKLDFVTALKLQGNACLGITTNSSTSPIDNFRWLYRTDFPQDDSRRYGNLRRAIAFFSEKFGPIDLIESFEEYWKPLEARLRQEFSIPGRTPEGYRRVSSKQESKKLFSHAGVPVAKSKIPRSQADCSEFFHDCNGKIIAKAENGAGCDGFIKIFQESDLRKLDLSKRIVLEEFLEGEIFTYDALLDLEGDVVDAFSLYYAPIDGVVSGKSETAITVFKELPPEG